MAISREESIHYLENLKEEKTCKDCNYVPCSAREGCEKRLSYLVKAISDMEKLQKIEELAKRPLTPFSAWDSMVLIEKIVKEVE